MAGLDMVSLGIGIFIGFFVVVVAFIVKKNGKNQRKKGDRA
ncbi:hypothetical protein O6R05_04715 [Peptoniphilus equinus]|uniref:DUF3149 domain-containing protein n=1 Tax=Peptoniphilus equinus TaxID=3016343 RepID=A0ABY7QTJ2_9FIRM|nr:hypothetical protein [Peptoniphilus equinus]WBW49315.1 hypothetical protein O6R05_04715 [Peptoniphilus equinus]